MRRVSSVEILERRWKNWNATALLVLNGLLVYIPVHLMWSQHTLSIFSYTQWFVKKQHNYAFLSVH